MVYSAGRRMDPAPDFGYESYKGHDRLAGKVRHLTHVESAQFSLRHTLKQTAVLAPARDSSDPSSMLM